MLDTTHIHPLVSPRKRIAPSRRALRKIPRAPLTSLSITSPHPRHRNTFLPPNLASTHPQLLHVLLVQASETMTTFLPSSSCGQGLLWCSCGRYVCPGKGRDG